MIPSQPVIAPSVRLVDEQSRFRAAPPPCSRLLAGPATAISASSRGVFGSPSNVAAPPKMKSVISLHLDPEAARDDRMAQLVGEDRCEEEAWPRRPRPQHRPVRSSQGSAPAGPPPPGRT